jgi:hypothetical protein
MKKLLVTLSASLLTVFMTACGAPDDHDSTVAAVSALPNLKASAPGFRCGQSVVVIEVRNHGNANAGSSFLRLDQTFAPSSASAIKSLKPGETARQAVTVRYKNGQLNATLQVDANRDVTESNEQDNILRLVCNG